MLFGEMSERELEIFASIGKGLSTNEIAEKLYVSNKTVESHRLNIKKRKLRIKSKDRLHALASSIFAA